MAEGGREEKGKEERDGSREKVKPQSRFMKKKKGEKTVSDTGRERLVGRGLQLQPWPIYGRSMEEGRERAEGVDCEGTKSDAFFVIEEDLKCEEEVKAVWIQAKRKSTKICDCLNVLQKNENEELESVAKSSTRLPSLDQTHLEPPQIDPTVNPFALQALFTIPTTFSTPTGPLATIVNSPFPSLVFPSPLPITLCATLAKSSIVTLSIFPTISPRPILFPLVNT